MRKLLRLKDYDYAQCGYYFVTICSKEHRPIFGVITTDVESLHAENTAPPCFVEENGALVPLRLDGSAAPVGVDAYIDPHIRLSKYGRIVKEYIHTIPGIRVYVIMPNHVHLLVRIANGTDGSMWASTPTGKISQPTIQTLGTRIRSFKTLTMKAAGIPLWQRNYYDHVVRSEAEAVRVVRYVAANPARWADDEYYQI